MSSLLKIGVLGLTHDHIWGNLRDLERSERGTLVAAADPNTPLLERIAGQYDCRTYASYETMLDGESLDAVYVYGDNASGAGLVEMAAQRGLHAMVEKPMAATLAQAERMIRASANAEVVLMVNWPFDWYASLQHALKLAQDGAIGELYQVRYRAAHAGPKELGCTPYFYNWLYDREKNGAGALMDYCCYGAVLCRYLLGQPLQVTGVAGRLQKSYVDVDDNAVLLLGYHHAIGIAEASWTQVGNLTSYTPVFYGSEGTIVVPSDGVQVATADQPEGEFVDVPQPPEERRMATDYFLSRITSGEPVEGLANADISRDAQEILEAGLISARTGAQVSLPLRTELGAEA
jgi:predicted dehydrogenase